MAEVSGKDDCLEAGHQSQAVRLIFGAFQLDLNTLELTRGDVPIALDRKSLQVLECLLGAGGNVITKDEFVTRIWSGRSTSDAALAKCISRLRQALQDKDHAVIKTAHGFGYRVGIDVTTEFADEGSSGTRELTAGDGVPSQPDWQLVCAMLPPDRTLWLARSLRDRTQRSYRFAWTPGQVMSLKQELEIANRLQSGSSGARFFEPPLDHNLEAPPFFIAFACKPSGNLREWLAGPPPSHPRTWTERLKVFIQVTEAVAHAHEAGVVHGALTPERILINKKSQAVTLIDFQHGLLLEGETIRPDLPEYAELAPIYGAPERLAGEPPSRQGDIYSLGVLLYQLVIGDLGKPLAPGWEKQIDNDLLRADISLAVAGELTDRLDDASRLATRLRDLRRRMQRNQAATQLRRQRKENRRLKEEVRRLHEVDEARRQAETAARTTRAVCDFMNDEFLGGVRWAEQPDAIDFKTLLDNASAKLDAKLGAFPEAATEVHLTLGTRYFQTNNLDAAQGHWQAALQMLSGTHGETAVETISARSLLGMSLLFSGSARKARSCFHTNSQIISDRWPEARLIALYEHYWAASCDEQLGQLDEAAQAYREVLGDVDQAPPLQGTAAEHYRRYYAFSQDTEERAASSLAMLCNLELGGLLKKVGQFREAEQCLQAAILAGTENGSAEWQLAADQLSLADLYAQTGRFDQARRLIAIAEPQFNRHFKDDDCARSLPYQRRGALCFEQQDAECAVRHLRRAWRLWPEAPAAATAQHVDTQYIPDQLAQAYLQKGELPAARQIFQQVLDYRQSEHGPDHFWNLPVLLGFAEAQISVGEIAHAATLSAQAGKILGGIRATAPNLRGELHRIESLILKTRGSTGARDSLHKARELLVRCFPDGHWRLKRIDLALA